MKLISASRSAVAVIAMLLLQSCGTSREELEARVAESFSRADYRSAVIDLKNLIRAHPQNARFRVLLAEALLRTGDPHTAAAELSKARSLGAPEDRVVPNLVEALVGGGNFLKALEELDRSKLPLDRDSKLLRLQGQAHLGLGRVQEARDSFSKALSVDSRDVTARLGLAIALERMNDPDAAGVEIEKAMELAPESFDARLTLAIWHARTNQIDRARAGIAKALEIAKREKHAGQEAAALVASAEVELAVQNVGGAETHLQRLETLAPKAENTLLLKARIAMSQERLDDAQVALQELLSLHPDSERAKLLMATVNLGQGNLEQALMFASAAVAASPENAATRKLLADIQLRQNKPRDVLKTVGPPTADVDADQLAQAGRASLLLGDLPAAIAYFERSHQVSPDDESQALNRAGAYLLGNRASDALKVLQELRPSENFVHRREFLLLGALAGSGRRDEARAEAKKFAQARPNDEEALLIAARGLLLANDVDGARALLESTTRLSPKKPRPWVALGLLEWSQKDRAAADRAFETALRLNPRDLEALLGRAQVAIAEGAWAIAIERLETARAAAPRALPPRTALIRLYLAQRDAKRALDVLAEAHKLAPEDPNVRLLGGLAALARGQATDAVTALERLARDFPSNAALQMHLAQACAVGGQSERAQAATEAALKIDPGHWPALALQVSLAMARVEQPGADDALARLRRSQAPRPLVAALEGDLAMSRRQYSKAVGAYSSAHAAAPSGQTAVKLYSARRAMGAEDAQASLRNWLQKTPDDTGVRLVLADDLQSRGDVTAAASEYEAILRASPDQVIALNNLAWLKLERGELAAGLELAQRAFDRNPKLPQVADTYGWALVQTGKAADAVPVLQTALHAAPNESAVRYHLAVALLKSGSKAEGERQLTAAVSSNERFPGSQDAKSLLQSLRGTAQD